jgi:HSP20 family protein
MALMRRERFDFPEWFRFEVPDVFRRMADLDPQSGWLRVEEYVDGGTLVVRAELPDIDPDKDVELSITDDGVLRISAQREEKTERKDKDVYRSEFRYGSFVRNVPLPEGVKEDDVTASYKDGILEIRAPIAAAEEKPPVTRVPISRG